MSFGDKYKLDQGAKPRAVADDLIYNSGNTFAIPYFFTNLNWDHQYTIFILMYFISQVMKVYGEFWRNQSVDIDDWNKMF